MTPESFFIAAAALAGLVYAATQMGWLVG